MVDFNAKEKHRRKVNTMVEERRKKTGEGEEVARTEVMKELRLTRKTNKSGKHEAAEKIKEEMETAMAGQEKRLVEKAVRKAVAKHFSQVRRRLLQEG